MRLRSATSFSTPPRPFQPPKVYSSLGNHSPEEPIRGHLSPCPCRQRPGGRIPWALAPPHSAPCSPGREGLGAGAGAWSSRIRTEGAAAGPLTRCRCLGAVVTVPLLLGAAHAKDLPLSSLFRRPGESPAPTLKGERMRRPQRTARSAFGGLSPSGGAPVSSEPGGEPRGGADRCGPRCPLPLPPPRRHPHTHPPPPRTRRDAPRESYNFPETSSGAWQTSASSCSARPSGCAPTGAGGAAEELVMGAFSPFPARRRPCRPVLACALAGTHTAAGQPSANSNAAVSGGAVGDAAVRGSYQAGEGRSASPAGRQARGFEVRAEIPNFPCTRARLWTP